MNKVLLTGANGFTGKFVTSELVAKGYNVIGVVCSEKAKKGQIYCDLRDKDAVLSCLKEVKPDYIIHLAALSYVEHKQQEEFYNINIFGALNLLDAATELKLNLKKVILASSANVYGSSDPTGKITESNILCPVNHYSMSKIAMEQMAKLWFDRLPIIITRPFNYTGPGQDERFIIPKIVSHFKNNKKTIELGNINIYRDFSDVRDIARYYSDLLQSDIISDVVNLCSGNTYSLTNIINIMEGISNYKINIEINTKFIRNNDINILSGDNSKLKTITKCECINIEQTLSDMYKY